VKLVLKSECLDDFECYECGSSDFEQLTEFSESYYDSLDNKISVFICETCLKKAIENLYQDKP